jgi:hypothetical protein
MPVSSYPNQTPRPPNANFTVLNMPSDICTPQDMTSYTSGALPLVPSFPKDLSHHSTVTLKTSSLTIACNTRQPLLLHTETPTGPLVSRPAAYSAVSVFNWPVAPLPTRQNFNPPLPSLLRRRNSWQLAMLDACPSLSVASYGILMFPRRPPPLHTRTTMDVQPWAMSKSPQQGLNILISNTLRSVNGSSVILFTSNALTRPLMLLTISQSLYQRFSFINMPTFFWGTSLQGILPYTATPLQRTGIVSWRMMLLLHMVIRTPILIGLFPHPLQPPCLLNPQGCSSPLLILYRETLGFQFFGTFGMSSPICTSGANCGGC